MFNETLYLRVPARAAAVVFHLELHHRHLPGAAWVLLGLVSEDDADLLASARRGVTGAPHILRNC